MFKTLKDTYFRHACHGRYTMAKSTSREQFFPEAKGPTPTNLWNYT